MPSLSSTFHPPSPDYLFLHTDELEIVSLFEEYAWLKDLLDHHDAREKAFLFAILDKKLQGSEKLELISTISKQLSSLARDNV